VTGIPLNIGNLAASIAVRGGRLSADLAEVGIEQGTASGRIFIDSSAPETRLGIRVKLEQVSLTRLAAFAAAQPTIEGRGDVMLDLTAEGATLGAALKYLNGEARLRAQNGGRIWIPLKQLVADAEAVPKLAWKSTTKGDTAFDDLTADFAVKHGRLLTETVVVKARGLAIMMDGIVNIGVQQIYARLHVARDGGGFPFIRNARQQHSLVLVGDLSAPSVLLERDEASSIPVESPKIEKPAEPTSLNAKSTSSH
jgi:AsmA protein